MSVPYENYSPDMISKNKAIQESLVMSLSVEDHPWETDYMQWGAEIWRGRNQAGGGFLFLIDPKLSAQEKVDGAHVIEVGFWVPHCREGFYRI